MATSEAKKAYMREYNKRYRAEHHNEKLIVVDYWRE